MMLVNDLKLFQDNFECVTLSNVIDNTIYINGLMCSQYLPVGNLSKQYFIDKKYKEVNFYDYVTPLCYFAYYQPLSYDLFNHYFNINDSLNEYIKNKQVNIYEVELIMGGLLKNMGGYKDITTHDCYKYKRHNETQITINTPPNLLNNQIIITTSSETPNRIYLFDYTMGIY